MARLLGKKAVKFSGVLVLGFLVLAFIGALIIGYNNTTDITGSTIQDIEIQGSAIDTGEPNILHLIVPTLIVLAVVGVLSFGFFRHKEYQPIDLGPDTYMEPKSSVVQSEVIKEVKPEPKVIEPVVKQEVKVEKKKEEKLEKKETKKEKSERVSLFELFKSKQPTQKPAKQPRQAPTADVKIKGSSLKTIQQIDKRISSIDEELKKIDKLLK